MPGIANSRNIRAGAAYIELTTQDSKLVRGLDQAQKRVKAFVSLQALDRFLIH